MADVQIRVDCDPLHTGQKRLGNRVREYDKGTSAAFILRVHRLLWLLEFYFRKSNIGRFDT